jgi:hypothetical protein
VPACLPQVLALVSVALLHLIYLRVCLPFRMRIELAAGELASPRQLHPETSALCGSFP